MSVFAFVAAAAARLVKPDPRDAEIATLKAKLSDARRERDSWKGVAEGWRSQLYGEIEQRQPTINPAFYPQAMQLNQQAQMNPLFDFCNCVPARHDMFLPSGQR